MDNVKALIGEIPDYQVEGTPSYRKGYYAVSDVVLNSLKRMTKLGFHSKVFAFGRATGKDGLLSEIRKAPSHKMSALSTTIFRSCFCMEGRR